MAPKERPEKMSDVQVNDFEKVDGHTGDSILEHESKKWLPADWERYLKSLEGGLKESQFPSSDVDQTDLVGGTLGSDIISNDSSRSHDVETILGLLSEKQRQVIYAIYWEGDSERKIAKRMGISRSAVQRLKARAINKLKARYPDTVSIFPIVRAHTEGNGNESEGGENVD